MSRKKLNPTPAPKVELSLKEQVLSSLDGRIHRNNKTLENLTEENKFSSYHIKWDAEELVICEVLKKWLENFRCEIGNCKDEVEVRKCLVLYLKSVISYAKSSTHNNTSAFSNAIHFAEQKAHFEIIDFIMHYIFD